MKTKITGYAVTIIGLLLLAAGLCLLKMNGDPQGIMLALPYVCIGIGCGLFGQGMGNIISERAVRSNPEIQKKLEIEKNDERNIAIANRAKGKAYDMARRKILCKRYSTKVKNGAGKQGEFWPKSLVYRKPWRSERYARRHGVNAGLAVVAY